MHTRHTNRLKMHRRRAGFSQGDVAYLLGSSCGSRLSRYERGHRLPTLLAALRIEALYRTPIREIFHGAAASARDAVAGRARELAGTLDRTRPCPLRSRKLEALRAVSPPPSA